MKRDNYYLTGNQFVKGSKANDGVFKSGHIPWNKGIKGLHLSSKSEFKKGQMPKNYLPVGSLTTRTDKSGKRRRWIKIEEPKLWIEYAKFIWIKHNGQIPKGYLIHHIDTNSLNDDINNLSLLTRKGHFEIHDIGNLGRIARQVRLSGNKQEKDGKRPEENVCVK